MADGAGGVAQAARLAVHHARVTRVPVDAHGHEDPRAGLPCGEQRVALNGDMSRRDMQLLRDLPTGWLVKRSAKFAHSAEALERGLVDPWGWPSARALMWWLTARHADFQGDVAYTP